MMGQQSEWKPCRNHLHYNDAGRSLELPWLLCWLTFLLSIGDIEGWPGGETVNEEGEEMFQIRLC